MKKFKPFARHVYALLLVLSLFLAGRAVAQTNAYDTAANYNRNSWFTNRLSFGYGFTPWVLFFTNNTTGKSGFTIVNGLGIGSGITNSTYTNAAFGLFANQGAYAAMATAFRGFSNSLPVGNVFKLQWAPLSVGSLTTAVGGFNLRHGNDTVNTNWSGDPNMRFAFYYAGGGANSFSVFDGNGFNNIGVPFNSTGFQCDLTLETADTYRFEVRATNGVILYLADNQPLGGTAGQTLDSFSWFDFNTSGNMIYNTPEIVSGNSVPPSIVNILPTNGAPYVVAGTTNVSFEVDTLASTLTTNSVTLLLNGVAQTNLLFNTNGTTQQLLVTNNTPLTPNTLYYVTIIATDGFGNRATNSLVSFNTWLPTDPYIEAEDYNYGAGLFLVSAFPDANDFYANLLGTNGIDYNDTTPTNLNVYRSGDLTQILAGNDSVDHANYAVNGYADYYSGYNSIGDWMNYTRVLDTNVYNIYARVAGFGTTPLMELDRLAAPTATITTQPLAALGSFNIPGTGGTAAYTFTPLVDFFGNTVAVKFPGTNTLRTTAIGGDKAYNFNYLILTAISNSSTLRPYVSLGSPTAGASGVALDSAISFTIANRTTAVNPATLSVLLNGSNVTSSSVISTNLAGVSVKYVPVSLFGGNTTNTVTAIFTDTGSTNNVTVTNTWTFTTINATNTIIPGSYAKPYNSGTTNGFGLTLFKILDTAPVVGTLSNAFNELNGLLVDTNTGTNFVNLATNPITGSNFYLDTNVIAFDITGSNTGSYTFTNRSPFPYVPATNVANNIVMQSSFYLQLTNGGYHLVVRSDDGFELSSGPTPTQTNTVLGLFDLGRANTTPSDIYFTVTNSGLYPMSLFYVQESSGGNVEFYSIRNGVPILINDPTNPNAIQAFEAISTSTPVNPITITNANYAGGVFTFRFLTQSGHTHYVEYTTSLPSTGWTALTTVTGTGSITNITDGSAGGSARYYRVRTQ